MRRFIPLVFLAGALLGWHQGQDEKFPYKSYLGKPVPALTGGKGDWLNAQEAPKLHGVKGRTVLLVFTSLF